MESNPTFVVFQARFLEFIKQVRRQDSKPKLINSMATTFIYEWLKRHPEAVFGDQERERVAEAIGNDLKLHFRHNEEGLLTDEIRERVWKARAGLSLMFIPQEKDTEISQLLARKRLDYGAHNIISFAESGIIIRCYDKTERIRNICARGGSSAVGESELDAWVDIVGYCAVAYLFLNNMWKQ
jgi:hypothetical protein